MSTSAKSASEFGTHRKRKIDEFVDENLVLLGLEHVTVGDKGAALPNGPFYVVKACIDNTGEMVEFLSSQKYLSTFWAAVKEAGEYPVNFRILRPGKSYEIGDWE